MFDEPHDEGELLPTSAAKDLPSEFKLIGASPTTSDETSADIARQNGGTELCIVYEQCDLPTMSPALARKLLSRRKVDEDPVYARPCKAKKRGVNPFAEEHHEENNSDTDYSSKEEEFIGECLQSDFLRSPWTLSEMDGKFCLFFCNRNGCSWPFLLLFVGSLFLLLCTECIFLYVCAPRLGRSGFST